MSLQSGRVVLATGALAVLTACGGSGTGPLPVQRGSLADTQAAAAFPPADVATTVFVASRDNGRILGFPAGGTGNILPSVSIFGPHTQLSQPDALAVDATGRIYAANDGGSRILIFAPHANGDPTPQVLGGSNVPLQTTEGAAVDATGRLYVSDYSTNTIFVFAAGATGNTAPVRTISGRKTELDLPLGMAVDLAGNLLVANGRGPRPILKFSATANGDVAPVSYIAGVNTKITGVDSVSLDAAGRILVPNYGGSSLLIFKPGAQGNVAPVATISGTHTTLTSLSSANFDSKGEIYAASSAGSIVVFSSTANGNAAPIRRISGSNTKLNNPFHPSFH